MAVNGPRTISQPLTVLGAFKANGDIATGLTVATAHTGGGDFYGRHLYMSVVGGVHWFDLNGSVYELARLMADGNPASAVEFKVGTVGSPLGIIAWSIDITTGAMHLAARLSVDEGADFAKAGGVTLVGQSTTSGIVTPLTIQAKNSAGTVVSALTFSNAGAITATNPSGLDIPFAISSGYVRVDGMCRATEVNKGTVTTSAAIDWTTGNTQVLTMTSGSALTLTFTAPPGVGWLTLRVITAGTIGVITWPAAVKWSGGTKLTPATTGGRTGVYRIFYDGTNYWADCTRDMA